MLKPLDIVILLKILSSKEAISQEMLSKELFVSEPTVNVGLERLRESQLLSPIIGSKSDKYTFVPIIDSCIEALVTGVKYFFPVESGVYTRGLKTGVFTFNDFNLVWPDGDGNCRGLAITPLHPSVIQSITVYPNKDLYQMLCLVDTMRLSTGKSALPISIPERKEAENMLTDMINGLRTKPNRRGTNIIGKQGKQ